MNRRIPIIVLLTLCAISGIAAAQTEIVSVVSWVDYFIHNPLRSSTKPYTDIIGFDFFITWILLAMGGALYLSERSLPQVVGYFMMVFLFLAVALNAIVLAVFGIVAALITTSLLYKALAVKRGG